MQFILVAIYILGTHVIDIKRISLNFWEIQDGCQDRCRQPHEIKFWNIWPIISFNITFFLLISACEPIYGSLFVIGG